MALYKKNDDWYIDYYVNGRRKREKIGPSRSLAETVLRKRRVEIAENRFLDIKREQKIKFEDFADEYLEIHSKPNNRSWKDYDLSNIKRLKEFFGGRYLCEITTLLVEKFKIERSKMVSPSATNRSLACLKSIFNKAIAWGRFIGTNPVNGVKFFKEQNQRTRYLEKEEIVRLLSFCRGNMKPIVIVALNTGMRRGEIFGLKWQDIDFRRGVVHLLRTKNNEKREIPINEAVKAAFVRVRKHPDSPYVFCDNQGNPYHNLRKSFFTALERAGIINFRFHDLRHTFASQLVMSGVDLNTVRELLGHKSLDMTLRYSHLSPDHKKRAVDVLNSRMDAFWTPEPIQQQAEESNRPVTVLDSIN